METVDKLWSEWESQTTDLCKIKTYDGPDNPRIANIKKCRSYIQSIADQHNEKLTNYKMQFFQWCEIKDKRAYHEPTENDIDNSEFWVFGYRIGPDTATHKIAVICHLDTVSAAPAEGWNPFMPEVESNVEYPLGSNKTQNFLVGRGCIDDKGPAMSAFIVFRALASNYDGTDLFNTTQVEIIFDTSEETAMSTPKYIADPRTRVPDFGAVYDAMWCVRAEKGCERPVFLIPKSESVYRTLYVSSFLTSPDNSVNTIPDWAEAEIAGDPSALEVLNENIHEIFESFVFDDVKYNPGELKTETKKGSDGNIEKVVLHIDVKGAQHGSAPDENRETGVNPFVSLANFIAGLQRSGQLGANSYTTIAQFVEYVWGTRVFGENHEALCKYDEVFDEHNGTTYAVTHLSETKENSLQLAIDIRYALDHHSIKWDRITEGQLKGDSIFKPIFESLVKDFNAQHSSDPDVSCVPKTMFGPDIRIPETNENYKKAEAAFFKVMGEKPPPIAVGGGTDAKGILTFLALGPLFSVRLGAPINYHGIREGAPMDDMKLSTEILYELFAMELTEPSAAKISKVQKQSRIKKTLDGLKLLAARGHTHCCEK